MPKKNPFDDLLNRLLSTTKKAKQAEDLGIDPSLLSRFRSGRLKLTDSMAQKLAQTIAEKVNGSVEDIQDQLIRAAREIRPAKIVGSIQSAETLFDELSRERALLCVEYRDLPRTTAGTEYTPLARHAGRAVAKGLCFAMFQPFGSDDSARGKSDILPASVCRYRADIVAAVRDIHSQMLAYALAEQATGSSQLDLSNRLVLYEQVEKSADLAGFQSRLFYAVIPEDDFREKRQIWEWVSHEGAEDLFVLRGNLSLPAIYQQFFEITAYWDRKKELPVDKIQLAEGSRLAVEMGWIHNKEAPEPRWIVYPERKSFRSEATRSHGKKRAS